MEHLARMHTDIESTTRKLELEQRRLYNLDKMLHSAETEWDVKRKKYKALQSSVDSAVDHKADLVRVLERNLVKAIEDLNKGNDTVELLREQIDQLRKERTILNSVFETMIKDIKSHQKLLEKEKDKINESRDSCEEAKHKTEALNKMLEKERRAFKITVFGKKPRHPNGLLEELHNESEVQKEQDNLNRFQKTESGAGKKGGKKAYMVADEEEAFSEPQMHRRILKLSFLNTIQRRHIKQHQKNIEVFEQAFATIKSSTGISDIEEIVKIFIALEQRNFSLLTYVNELNRDIETIEIRNRELQNQLKTYQSDNDASAVRKKEALSELQDNIQKTRAATEEKDNMIKDSVDALSDCRPLILKIVNHLKQQIPTLIQAGYEGDPPAMKMSTPEDHEENLNNYLMYIEEAILQFRVSLSQDAQHQANLRPQPPRVPPQRPQKPSELPSAHITGDDSDDDPDTGLGDRPWTRNELRDRAQAMIQRRKRKQHGKLMGEDKRTEAVEDAPTTDSARARESAPPPAREYAASSAASKESKENESGLSKSPSVGAPTAEGERPENWWRGKGEEKGR